MGDDHGLVRRVAWPEVFPWLILFRTIRLAADFRKLLLAAAGLLLTFAGWRLCDKLFAVDIGSNEVSAVEGEMLEYPRTTRQVIQGFLPDRLAGWAEGDHSFLQPWVHLAWPFYRLFSPGLPWPRGLAYLLATGLWALAVWALFGGAITRMAAMEFAVEERVGLKKALRHAAGKWRSYFAAPLMPLVGILLGVLLILTPLGLFVRFTDLGLLVAGIVWPLMLLGGLVMALLLVGLLFGWPLMWGAIGVECMDSWDALSRAYAYVLHRPLRYLFYAIVCSVLGFLGWLIVAAFTSAVVYLPLWGMSWATGGERFEQVQEATRVESPDWSSPARFPWGRLLPVEDSGLSTVGRWGAALIAFWSGCVRVLGTGFTYSFFWTASTGIYFLLRRDEDAAPLDQIHIDEPADASALPKITADEAGAPVVEEPLDGDNGPAGQSQ